MRGTSPKVWNAWKGKLLEDLYRLTLRALGGARPNLDAEIEATKLEARLLLNLAMLPGTVEVPLWRTLELSYFARHDASEIAWHTRSLIDKVDSAKPVVRARVSPLGVGLQVLVYAPDRQDLFARTCGYFDSANFNILDAKVHTTAIGYALDTFLVISPHLEPLYRDLIAYVETQLAIALEATGPLPEPSRGRISRRVRSFPVTPRVTLRPDERAQRWLLAVSASDRSGLLYAISRVLAPPRHQPAAGQDHDPRRARRGHLPDRRPRAAAEQDAAADRDRDARRDCLSPMAPRFARCPRGGAAGLGAARRPAGSGIAAPFPSPLIHGLNRISAAEAIADLGRFDTIIDARSEGEFAEDRLPDAVNWPSLDDGERAAIGTEYKQVSAFEAKKRGAALVARNVAAHVERHVLDKPREWTPLVYCWRGGKRSGALATVLEQIGFRVHVLEGGYRDFRRAVVAALETMPERLSTGGSSAGRPAPARAACSMRSPPRGRRCSTSRRLANHRGSVLGLVPGSRQPSQKAFDTRLWDALRRLDPSRPVFVESESKKIGDLRVPEALIRRMRASPCVWLELALDARVALLMADYDFFVTDIEAFCARLDALRALRGTRGRRCLAGRGTRRPHGRGRARPAGRALRPDLPRVDAAQLRRRRRTLRDPALGRQRSIAARGSGSRDRNLTISPL